MGDYTSLIPPYVLSDRRNSATAQIGALARLGENAAHRIGRGGRAVGMGERGAQTAQLLVARQRVPFADVLFGRGSRGHRIGGGVGCILHF